MSNAMISGDQAIHSAAIVELELAAYVGRPARTVMDEVARRYPGYAVHSIDAGGLMTADLRLDRIRIFIEQTPAGPVVKRASVG